MPCSAMKDMSSRENVVDLLYVSEQERKIDSFSMKIPMEETLNLEGIVSGDQICLRWEMEDLSVHTIHSRKLNIKAIVTFYALVEEIRELLLPAAHEAGRYGLRADMHEPPLVEAVIVQIDLAVVDGIKDVLRPGHK